MTGAQVATGDVGRGPPAGAGDVGGRRAGVVLPLLLIGLGLLLETLAIPPGPLPWLVLAADVPWLLLLLAPGARERWKRWTLLYGVLHFALALRWLGHIHPVQVVAAGIFLGPLVLLSALAIRLLVRRRVPWLLSVPTVLVLEEVLRTVWLGGMPWPTRSLSLSASPALVASTAWLGAYQLSFAAALSGAFLAGFVAHALGWRAASRRALVLGAVSSVLLLGVLFFAGTRRIDAFEARVSSGEVVRTTPGVLVAVQADIAQSLKHSGRASSLQALFDRHLEITKAALQREASDGRPVIAVLWPETMVPWPLVDASLAGLFPETWENGIRIVQNVAVAASYADPAPLFLLGILLHFRRGEETHEHLDLHGTHDSLLLLDPLRVPSPNLPPPPPPEPGTRPPWDLGRHDKRLLVPGGEYTPLGDVLPPLRWFRNLVSEIPELDAGAETQRPFDLGSIRDAEGEARPIRAATVICFEVAFPARCRALAEDGANVLLNAANYGWFGASGFRAQIRALAMLRAAETATTVVMAGNTGPTLFFDPVGRMQGRFLALEGGGPEPAGGDETTFRQGWASHPLTLDRAVTPYRRLGDLPWLALGGLALLLALAAPWRAPGRGS